MDRIQRLESNFQPNGRRNELRLGVAPCWLPFWFSLLEWTRAAVRFLFVLPRIFHFEAECFSCNGAVDLTYSSGQISFIFVWFQRFIYRGSEEKTMKQTTLAISFDFLRNWAGRCWVVELNHWIRILWIRNGGENDIWLMITIEFVSAAEISSITGLQQQIKAAFGRWRKKGQSTSSNPAADGSHPQSENSCSYIQPLPSAPSAQLHQQSLDTQNIRQTPHSQTFSHPHRVTVFPPFPGNQSALKWIDYDYDYDYDYELNLFAYKFWFWFWYSFEFN